MRRVYIVLSSFLFLGSLFQGQGVMAQDFENSIIKINQEIESLENKAREVEERIKIKLQAQAPSIEIKELEQEGLKLRNQIDALYKELVVLDKGQAEAAKMRAREEMYRKRDLEVSEINLKLEGARKELLELDKAYSQEIERGVSARDLEEMQIRMKQLRDEIKSLENELNDITKGTVVEVIISEAIGK